MTSLRRDLDASVTGPLAPAEAAALVADVRAYLLEQAAQVIGESPFLRRLKAGELPMERLRAFWLDWHSQVWEINNLVAVGYHLFTPFFKRNLDLLPLYADKVAEELTEPEPPGHMLVVWRQGELFGLTREQMVEHGASPPCRGLMEWHRGMLHEGTMAEFWTMISYEEYTGHWSQAFGGALVGAYGYDPDAIPYFRVHEEADLVDHDGRMGHGEFNWAVLRRLFEQGGAAFRPGFSLKYCVDVELALRRALLDFHSGA